MNIHLGKTHPSQYALIVAVCKRRAVGFSQLFFLQKHRFSRLSCWLRVVLARESACCLQPHCRLPCEPATAMWNCVMSPPLLPTQLFLCCFTLFVVTLFFWGPDKVGWGLWDMLMYMEQPGGASWTKGSTFWAPRLANNCVVWVVGACKWSYLLSDLKKKKATLLILRSCGYRSKNNAARSA